MKYRVYEVDEKTTSTGKTLKRLVLQGEGKQYPDKNVTMWGGHPLYQTAIPGATIDVEIDVTDGTQINPRSGLPYKNKTVRGPAPAYAQNKPQQPASTQPQDKFPASNAELKNMLTFKVVPKLIQMDATLQAICGHFKIPVPNGKGYDYPEMDETNDASGVEMNGHEIGPEDTPF